MKNPDRIVIHFAEIALKGRNRGDFEQRLRDNVAHRLKKLGLHWTVRRAHKYLFVEVGDEGERAVTQALDAIAHSSGVAWYAPARWLPGAQGGNGIEPDFGAIERNAVEVARESYRPGATFRLRVNRAWKPFPLTSDVLARDLGAAVIGQTDWDKVDLRRPDHVIHVDVHHDGVYVHGDRLPGLGGLPAGTSGRVLTLLSGGIDSPVAAYLMARRGCKVDFIHFSATSTQQREAATGKVAELARLVSCYTQHSRLWVVPFTPYELATLTDQTPYEVVLFRRFMARTAEALAGRIRAEALVTGDNLGQVASQTIENLVSFDRAVEIPVLRPLLAYDKQDIIEVARRLGTYETSIEPYKDCCSIVAGKPKTISRHERLTALEDARLPAYDALIAETLDQAVQVEFDCGDRVEAANNAA